MKLGKKFEVVKEITKFAAGLGAGAIALAAIKTVMPRSHSAIKTLTTWAGIIAITDLVSEKAEDQMGQLFDAVKDIIEVVTGERKNGDIYGRETDDRFIPIKFKVCK